jgi:hypothetical protein
MAIACVLARPVSAGGADGVEAQAAAERTTAIR